MKIELIAALVWRFAGIALLLFPVCTFLHYVTFRGGDELFLMSLFLMPVGVCLILFSKKLGSLTSKGL